MSKDEMSKDKMTALLMNILEFTKLHPTLSQYI